jgi:hypothetical protein
MAEFERARCTVGRRTLTITSWFDEGQQTWRASAPAYAHLSDLIHRAQIPCVSRKAAIEKLSSVLGSYFAAQDAAKSG